MYNKKFRWNSLLQKTAGLDHTAEKEELCRWGNPTQAENPAQQDSFLWQKWQEMYLLILFDHLRKRGFMLK